MKKVFIQVILVSGSLTAVAYFLFLILLYVMDLNPFGQYKMIYLPIYALGIVGGLKFYRDYRNGGYIGGGIAIFLALFINICAAFLYACLVYVLLAYADSSVLELHKKELTELLLKYKDVENLDVKQYEAQFESIKSISASTIAIDEWIKTLFVGLIMGMVIGLILKKSPPPAENKA